MFLCISILKEIIFITVVSIGLIWCLQNSFHNNEAWSTLTTPVVLVSAAIIPTILRKKDLSQIGFQIGQPKEMLLTLLSTCLVVFSALFCGILLLKYCKVPLPLRPIIPEKGWPLWILYQFAYVAVPEELFFRGYLQSNVTYLLSKVSGKKLEFLNYSGIIICAMVFAAFHVVLQGKIISVLTFFPGLIMGWLFYRTKSLFAPILFHGLANIGYGFISGVLY
jgi:membrane protease YdiL (CAAX protease family)